MQNSWSSEKAFAWLEKHGWLVGCNYAPQNAINQLEMWQEETFSPELIDKELCWAASIGFNTVRVFLHQLVWQKDSEAYLQRINQFLAIADKHNIKTMFVLFDSVWNPFPKLGKQPEPVKHVHNSGWVQCPGFDILNDKSRYDELFHYVNGVVDYFKNDPRVIVWDIFNEPDNMNMGSYKDDNYVEHKAKLSMRLLAKSIEWIRSINPSQPITSAPWNGVWKNEKTLAPLEKFMLENSDVISFHCYEDKKVMAKKIKQLSRYNKPLLCTEYMARPMGSTFQNILPLFKKYKVAAYSWGLVAGKSQTHCPWESWEEAKEPELWFHDIFNADGTPYKVEEVKYLRNFLMNIDVCAPIQLDCSVGNELEIKAA